MTFYTDPNLAMELLKFVKNGTKEAERSYEDLPKMVEVKISYDEDHERALESLARWRSSLLPNIFSKPIHDPRDLDKAGERLDLRRLTKYVFTDIDAIIKFVERLVKMGFNEIQVGSSSPDEEKFLDHFGKRALSYLKQEYSK